jgi:glycosyltransferase involved in cell wall biosynthesis
MADRVLHVGVDGRELLGKTTGVGRYVAEVLRCWSADPGWPHQVSIFVPAPARPALELGPRFRWDLDSRWRPGTWWEQRRLPGLLGAAGVDVLFAPAYTAPLRRVCPFVLVVHDVSFFAHPEWFTGREGLRRRWLTRASARRAARVLTVSEFSAREIVRWLGVPRAHIALAPPSAGSSGPTGPAGSSGPIGSSGPTGPVVLYVGSLFNRRRIPLLIDAFAIVARRHPAATLVLVGDNRTSPALDPRRLAADRGIADRVRWHAYVDDAALARLYTSATVFAFLSDYEGFGIPPMEALAHGVPSVLLDTAVSREIYGEAAALVAATPESVAAGLSGLIESSEQRQVRLGAGRPLLSRFTWTRTATAVRTALETAVTS